MPDKPRLVGLQIVDGELYYFDGAGMIVTRATPLKYPKWKIRVQGVGRTFMKQIEVDVLTHPTEILYALLRLPRLYNWANL